LSPVFRHGSLRLYLLRLLDEEPRHGYEVIRLLRDRFMGVYSPSPGTIYPRLARLEEEGLVTHDEVDGRKVYRITEAGREELRSRSDELDELEEELSASVSDIVREVREDVRQTVRSLREELTWAARESRRTARDASPEAREQARQARGEAREQARQARDEAYEQARQTRDESFEQARQARDEAKEQAQQAYRDAAEQARRVQEQGRERPGREDPWEQATDDGDPSQARATAAGAAAAEAATAAAGAAGAAGVAGVAGTGSGEAPGQDAARRVREHARWLQEEAQRVREESAEAGTKGFRDRIREEAGARFTGGEQDWDWAGRPSWTEWPGRHGWEGWSRLRGRRGWPGALDFETLKDLERVAVQFTSDLRKLAMQSTAAGENVITDLRTILEEALDRVKTEIFRTGPDAGTEPDAAAGPGNAGPASAAQGKAGPEGPAADPKDSPA
jgi:DNA-binding PadR family transcriptional regulator